MNLFDSPFYILGATPQDNRRKLAILADEKSFFFDAERIADARSILTTPSRRLSAEIRWFPEYKAEETAEIVDYCVALLQGNTAAEPEILAAGTLAALNTKLYSFPLKPFTGLPQMKDAILEISRLYASIDVEALRDEINYDRRASRFPEINDSHEMEDELTLYRSDFRKDISLRLMELPQQEYVALITRLAEKYSSTDDHYNGHAVLEDMITDYELHMTPEIERQKQQILYRASVIAKEAAEIRVSDAVNDLRKLITAWDVLAQPLQLMSRGRGQRHDASEDIAHQLRELAITLHNVYGKTDEALYLTEVLKQSFAELPDFSERINEDLTTLHQLKQEKELLKKVESFEPKLKQKKEAEEHNRKGNKYVVGFLILLIIAVGGPLASFGGPSVPATSTQKPSSTHSSSSAYSSSSTYSSSSAYTPPSAHSSPSTSTKTPTSSAPSNTQTNQQKLSALGTEMDALKIEIENMEDDLSVLSDDIDYYESMYYQTYDNTYADLYTDAVDEYNALWDDYDQAIDDYNDMVNEYNSLLN